MRRAEALCTHTGCAALRAALPPVHTPRYSATQTHVSRCSLQNGPPTRRAASWQVAPRSRANAAERSTRPHAVPCCAASGLLCADVGLLLAPCHVLSCASRTAMSGLLRVDAAVAGVHLYQVVRPRQQLLQRGHLGLVIAGAVPIPSGGGRGGDCFTSLREWKRLGGVAGPRQQLLQGAYLHLVVAGAVPAP